ncbi:hypothetical protein DFA_01962 [Cavenderia fasciculata]|uniref:Uncharacterized protein n=1 Tax=Cavenderia fasciculata TaxID=261658 RepID=F4PR15_CACFS|nr:uncharacterized protein DFA_01962 [Cavenderia fasciculata]EGG22072.1 hypothetical protein DFA_01962 [Cavenderia fasciculata]|eukprot:XP_004359923.1 hypothetical protein DFA_01962 [Cavenderia fasciculata]
MTTSTSSTGPVAPQRRDLTLFVHYRSDVTKISFNNVADHDDLRPIIRANPEFVIPRGAMLLFAEPPSNDNNAPARVPLDPLAAVTLADGAHLYVEVEEPSESDHKRKDLEDSSDLRKRLKMTEEKYSELEEIVRKLANGSLLVGAKDLTNVKEIEAAKSTALVPYIPRPCHFGKCTCEDFMEGPNYMWKKEL